MSRGCVFVVDLSELKKEQATAIATADSLRDDNQKSKSKDEYRGLSAAAQERASGRDDQVLGGN
jgi:hypothetical protein